MRLFDTPGNSRPGYGLGDQSKAERPTTAALSEARAPKTMTHVMTLYARSSRPSGTTLLPSDSCSVAAVNARWPLTPQANESAAIKNAAASAISGTHNVKSQTAIPISMMLPVSPQRPSVGSLSADLECRSSFAQDPNPRFLPQKRRFRFAFNS